MEPGCYNSGKSALMNLLIGKNQFDVGEAQTTTEPNLYKLGKLTLVDLPGLDTKDFDNDTFKDYLEQAIDIFNIVTKNNK
jgi:ribosome biogenesis GTPase A